MKSIYHIVEEQIRKDDLKNVRETAPNRLHQDAKTIALGSDDEFDALVERLYPSTDESRKS